MTAVRRLDQVGLATLIKDYYWDDSQEAMKARIEKCISGTVSRTAGITSFNVEPIRTELGGVILIAAALGDPSLLMETVEKVCSIVIEAERWGTSCGGRNDLSTRSVMLGFLSPPPLFKKPFIPEHERLFQAGLPKMDALPRQMVPVYRIALADNSKGAKLDGVSEVHLNEVLIEREEPKAKRRKLNPPSRSQGSQGFQLSFAGHSSSSGRAMDER